VEEHFYLILPPLVLWLMRRPAQWKAIAVFAFFVSLGIGIRSRVLLHTLRPLAFRNEDFGLLYIERIYYPTYCRLDGLLAGVGLALVKLFRPAWWSVAERRGHTLFISGVGLVAISLWLFKDRGMSATGAAAVSTVVGFPILSLGLVLIVASAISGNGLLRRIRVPGAGVVATLAFSLYLTHKGIIHLDEQIFPVVARGHGWLALGICAATSLLGATALYLCVERPFMVLRDRGASRRHVEVEREMKTEPAL
jgi:peptidoglycan/LPS O-acetylase OafA/YrhL